MTSLRYLKSHLRKYNKYDIMFFLIAKVSNNAYKKKIFDGYDAVVDNAKTDQQMCTPTLLSTTGPKIKTN